MRLVGVFAGALHILRAVDGQINIICTLAPGRLALDLVARLPQVVVALVQMVAETLGTEPDVLALLTVLIGPYSIQSVFTEGLVFFLVLFELLL